MNKAALKAMLQQVADGALSVDEAVTRINLQPYDDLDFAKIDTHRGLRQGADEVIYGEGKTAEQISGIVRHMLDAGQGRILITRMSQEKADAVGQVCELYYHPECRVGIVGGMAKPDGIGKVLIATGGTSDIPVAEEAALTAEMMGSEVNRMYDVGVAGLYRILAHTEDIMNASVIVAIAGMEGALASVIGGLADAPVIAVPTSVGYGASFGGVSALLSMLNSCASGVCVVNIDNGFGAGYLANMINHMNH
jgi:NCAIR mutase (PurE)-related protein